MKRLRPVLLTLPRSLPRGLVCLSSIFLAACAGGQLRSAPTAAAYDFGLPSQQLVADGSWRGLALEVRSPPWFESLNIDYRLNYDDPLKQREYSGSRWVGPPATLLAQSLRQQLGILGMPVGGAPCVLRVELQEFSQVFDTPQASHAQLSANVSLVDARRRVLAERRIAIDRPASSPDAHGGVLALVAAGGELGRMLADWLATLERSAAMKTCTVAPQA